MKPDLRFICNNKLLLLKINYYYKGKKMSKVINSKKAPAAIGPYSQAIETKNLLFISGQLPIDNKTGKFPSDNVTEQTYMSLNNIKFILEEAKLSFKNVIKTTCYLSDISDFAEMNKVYSEFFEEPYPARVALAVKDLPKGAKIEIEVIAEK